MIRSCHGSVAIVTRVHEPETAHWCAVHLISCVGSREEDRTRKTRHLPPSSEPQFLLRRARMATFGGCGLPCRNPHGCISEPGYENAKQVCSCLLSFLTGIISPCTHLPIRPPTDQFSPSAPPFSVSTGGLKIDHSRHISSKTYPSTFSEGSNCLASAFLACIICSICANRVLGSILTFFLFLGISLPTSASNA
jgi:hypothetical protein